MLGIEDYGSGSDNDSEHDAVLPVKANTTLTRQPTSGSSISLPPPKAKRPKKIAIGLPSLPACKRPDDEDDLTDERPVTKRPRLENGAGKSSLLSMLPVPKEKVPVTPTPERLLGGGKGRGLDFGAARPTTDSTRTYEEDVEDDTEPSTSIQPQISQPTIPESLPFRPTSLKKGRTNVSVEEDKPKSKPQATQKPAPPPVDFFSLGASSSKVPAASSISSKTTPSIPTLSSAPVVPTFEIPEPSQTDEYPGYYQLPSGAWAAHDPTYYAKFLKKWQDEYNAHVRALEKGMVKGFEDLETAGVEEVDAMAEMERAKREIKEREDRKAITQGVGVPAAPKMTITASKMSGIARSRHQLSTLLKEAYENREALEEKIAMGKRNRKEAGNKYGF